MIDTKEIMLPLELNFFLQVNVNKPCALGELEGNGKAVILSDEDVFRESVAFENIPWGPFNSQVSFPGELISFGSGSKGFEY